MASCHPSRDLLRKPCGQRFAAKLGHQYTTFCLAQDRKDLGFAISRHLHLNLLVHLAEKTLLLQPLTLGGDYP